MSLFQNTVVSKYLQSQNKELLATQWSLFKSFFHNPEIQENIRNSKEEQYQGEFLIDLFVNILGYTKNPTPNFNLTTEYKNIKDSKKADGAIVINENVKAVIELKGTNTTDLSKIETQAFGYKNNQAGCSYVITSNFEKLRFYIDNAIEHIEFNLFNLSEKEFELLYLCLAYENVAKDIPKKLKDESVGQEDVITKKLYNDYSLFKRELHQSLVALNPEYDALVLFKKSQKLIDRFLFLFFAEDRQLLPPNSVRLILEQWKQLAELDEAIPLYNRFKKYFGYLNTGFKGKNYDVYAYNGGLFKPDEILDNISIDDTILYNHTFKLSEYDFISEVDVNILGHIFENSLNELDEITAQLEGQEVDKTKTRRKKDGVFYTPKYITKYIVDNTIGKLCDEKKVALHLNEDDYTTDKKRQKKITQELLGKLTNYRNWLLELTICDPACGSGAFLNQALDYLITEHKYIDELQAKLFGDAMVLSDVEKNILENNLFGVDINEESVEIAKLSLWLRTAQPNRKLNDLNNNIKCGNSLIDDPTVAGDKAFNWQREFPQIFSKGGFDVVIGNPPYVRVEFIDEASVYFYKKNYVSATGKFDLSSLFFEKSITLINPNGIYSIITSYQFIYTTSGIGLRKFISENTLCKIIKFSSDTQIFSDATTYAGIFIVSKEKSDDIFINEANNKLQSVNIIKCFKITKTEFCQDKVVLDSANIIKKIEDNPNYIMGKDIGMAKTGVVSSADEIFFLTQEQIIELNLEKELIYPIIGSDELNSWHLNTPNIFCLYPYYELEGKTTLIELSEIKEKYPNVYKYFISNRPKLTARSKGRQDYSESEKWYQLNRPREKWIYDAKKIIYPGTTNQPKFSFDEKGQMFRNARVYAFLLKDKFTDLFMIVLPILNSSLCKYMISLKCPPKANNYFELSTGFMDSFPFILPDDLKSDFFIKKGEMMQFLNKEFHVQSQKFRRTIQRKFELEDLPKKLQDWYKLSYSEFIKELGKKKVKLTLSQEAEWETYFLQEAKKALDLKTTIDTTDKQIDQMVYELYGLTEDEISIIENS